MARVWMAAVFLGSVMIVAGSERKGIWPPFTPETNRYARRVVTEDFHIVRSLRDIDPAVLSAYYKVVPRRDIAVGTQAFAETDVSDGKLNRFDFAGHTSDLWFILYEVGGRAYHHSVIFFQRDGAYWRQVAAAAGFSAGNDFPSFVRAVRKGKFDEMTDGSNL